MIDSIESELVRRAKAGEQDAFETIVRLHEKPLYALALRTLRSPEDAADALQETFLKAWTGLNGFRGGSKLSVWLYRIMLNVCTDALRRRKETVSLTRYEDEESAEQELPDERYDPARIVERQDLRARVRTAVERLPEDFRRPLLLREFGGLSYEEIAGLLDLPAATVKTRIYRARQKLYAMLASDGNFSDAPSSKPMKEGDRT